MKKSTLRFSVFLTNQMILSIFLKAIISECFAQLLSEMKQLVGDSIKFAMKLYKKGSINEKSILFHLFFPCPPLGKNCSLVILVFPQGKKGKGKTEKNISRPRRCLGLKNLFSRFFLFLFYLGEKQIGRASCRERV